MASLSIPKNYEDGTVFFESDVDDIRDTLHIFINVTKLNDDNLQDDGITASTKIIDGTITNAKLTDGTIERDKLNANIVDDSTLELDSTFIQVKDGGITRAKQAAVGQQISSSSGNFTTTATSFTDVTNLSQSITVTDRPVMIVFQSDSTDGFIGTSSTAENAGSEFQVLRDATVISKVRLGSIADTGGNDPTQTLTNVPPGSLTLIDFGVPSAGTYTYKLQVQSTGGGTTTTTVNDVEMAVFEL